MKSVLNLLVLHDENALIECCEALTQQQRKDLINTLRQFLNLSEDQLDAQILRILLERARPMIISEQIWKQPLTSSDPIAQRIQMYLTTTLGLLETDIDAKTLQALQLIASDFKEPRAKVRVTLDLLKKTDYRCSCCGYHFKDEDLEDLDIELPDEQKALANNINVDAMHPISQGSDFARPRADHIWPVSLYGSNREENLTVLCHACNSGKANYMSYAHAKPNVGVFSQKSFSGPNIEPEVFYSVVSRDRKCIKCNALPSHKPLTIRKKVHAGVPLPDNLYSVCYECAGAV